MKNRKALIMLLCMLVATSVALAACQPGASPSSTACAAHTDVNNDGLCDNCGIQVGFQVNSTSSAGNVQVSFSVFNDFQVPMTGAKITATDRYTDEVFTATVGEDGTVTMDLPESDYSVGLEDLPENHVAGFKTVSVVPDMEVITFTVIDNTPDGSQSRPYFIGADAVAKDFGADASLYFTMRFGWGRALIIDNANVEVTIKGEKFEPDANGRVEIRIDDAVENEHVLVYVTNKGDAQNLNLQPLSDPGTLENPLELELGKDMTAQVKEGHTLTYSWTATADGTVTVGSDNANGSLQITNKENSRATGFTNTEDRGSSVSMEVKAGDEISVEVTVLKATDAEYDEVVFKLAYDVG